MAMFLFYQNIALSEWMKNAYHLRSVDVLRLFLPSTLRNGKVKDKFEKILILSEEIDIDEVGSMP